MCIRDRGIGGFWTDNPFAHELFVPERVMVPDKRYGDESREHGPQRGAVAGRECGHINMDGQDNGHHARAEQMDEQGPLGGVLGADVYKRQLQVHARRHRGARFRPDFLLGHVPRHAAAQVHGQDRHPAPHRRRNDPASGRRFRGPVSYTHLFRGAGRMDRHKGPLSLAEKMDLPRDDVFSRSGFPIRCV